MRCKIELPLVMAARRHCRTSTLTLQCIIQCRPLYFGCPKLSLLSPLQPSASALSEQGSHSRHGRATCYNAQRMANSEIKLLLTMIDQAFDHKSWHGTNLRGSIRGISVEQAARRPSPNRHNIWEIAVHAAYWKYVVRRRLMSESRGSFPIKGSNWFERPEPGGGDESTWKSDLALLNEIHTGMRRAVAGLRPGQLYKIPAGSKV